MAKLIGGMSAAIRMDQVDVADLQHPTFVTRTDTNYAVDLGSGVTINFQGSGFRYSPDGTLGGGTILQITEKLNGAVSYDISSANTDAEPFATAVKAGDSQAALQLIFAGHDTLQGTAFADYLNGYSGHDNLFGGDGADTIHGGTGNDHLYGQSSNGGLDGADMLFGEDGGDYLQGNAGADTLDGGAGSDRMQGGQGDDLMSGGTGNDSMNGNLGNDTLDGGDGNDLLRGGQGNDRLTGNAGADTLSGDLGVDTMTGGTSIDYFVFGGSSAAITGSVVDRITDFEDGIDRIGLGFTVAAILSGSAQPSFSAAQTLAQQLLDGHAGDREVAAISVGSDTYLFYTSDRGSTVNSAVILGNTAAAEIGLSDFL